MKSHYYFSLAELSALKCLTYPIALCGALVADDIARSVIYAYQQPQGVCVRKIVISITRQQP